MTDDDKVPIVLISKTIKNKKAIETQLEELTSIEITKYFTELAELDIILSEQSPCIVILGPDFDFSEIQRLIQDKEYNLQFVRIVILVKNISSELLKKAISLGISEVLQFPFNTEELNSSLNNIKKRLSQFITKIKENASSNKSISKNILTFSTKGGSGKSFLATNIALDIQKQTAKKTVIYDLHYENGDISLMLDIYPKNTIYDMSTLKEKFSSDILYNILANHKSGVRILPAPLDPAQAESIDIDLTLKIFDTLSEDFNYMVIDSPPRFSEEVLAIINKIDWLCLISSLDVTSIKNLKLALKILGIMNFPENRIMIIMNRSNSKVGIDLSELEETISRKIDIFIPSNIIVPRSINRGSPVIESYPKSSISKNINKLTSIILNGNQTS
jgi:pilus assembly protein CpaE